MRRVGLVAVVAAAFAVCSPGPRDVSYLKAHSEEAATIAAGCAGGAHRGAECDNAREATAEIDADARMAEYKKPF